MIQKSPVLYLNRRDFISLLKGSKTWVLHEYNNHLDTEKPVILCEYDITGKLTGRSIMKNIEFIQVGSNAGAIRQGWCLIFLKDMSFTYADTDSYVESEEAKLHLSSLYGKMLDNIMREEEQ